MTNCPKLSDNETFISKYPYDVISIYGIFDCTPIAEKITNATDTFSRLGLLQYSKNVKKMIARLLIQPSQELAEPIFETLKEYDIRQCISIQVRMGGNVSNHKEKHVFMTPEVAIKYLNRVRKENPDVECIYLSADSENTVKIVQEVFKNTIIIQNTQFNIGHSRRGYRNKDHLEGLKRGLVDAILASHGYRLYHTGGSSFGKLIGVLTCNTTIVVMSSKWTLKPFGTFDN